MEELVHKGAAEDVQGVGGDFRVEAAHAHELALPDVLDAGAESADRRAAVICGRGETALEDDAERFAELVAASRGMGPGALVGEE